MRRELGVHAIEVSNECRLLAPLTQKSRPYVDRSQRVAQVVAKNRQEAFLKLLDSALLRSCGALCGRKRAQVLFRLSALGEIARDLREPDQRAVGVAQRGDDDVGPEPRAVLADAPAFVLEPSFARRDLQLALALARRDVLRRIEHREVLADDLVGRVALDARGARRSRSRRGRSGRA